MTSSVSMRRRLWTRFLADSEPGGDYYLWVRLSPVVHFVLLKRILVTYREHRGGISKRLAERMVPSVRRTHQFQLERLGVEPNLDLHAMLSAWPSTRRANNLLRRVSGCAISLLPIASTTRQVFSASRSAFGSEFASIPRRWGRRPLNSIVGRYLRS